MGVLIGEGHLSDILATGVGACLGEYTVHPIHLLEHWCLFEKIQ